VCVQVDVIVRCGCDSEVYVRVDVTVRLYFQVNITVVCMFR
jgi:hypothetical protein